MGKRKTGDVSFLTSSKLVTKNHTYIKTSKGRWRDENTEKLIPKHIIEKTIRGLKAYESAQAKALDRHRAAFRDAEHVRTTRYRDTKTGRFVSRRSAIQRWKKDPERVNVEIKVKLKVQTERTPGHRKTKTIDVPQDFNQYRKEKFREYMKQTSDIKGDRSGEPVRFGYTDKQGKFFGIVFHPEEGKAVTREDLKEMYRMFRMHSQNNLFGDNWYENTNGTGLSYGSGEPANEGNIVET